MEGRSSGNSDAGSSGWMGGACGVVHEGRSLMA